MQGQIRKTGVGHRGVPIRSPTPSDGPCEAAGATAIGILPGRSAARQLDHRPAKGPGLPYLPPTVTVPAAAGKRGLDPRRPGPPPSPPFAHCPRDSHPAQATLPIRTPVPIMWMSHRSGCLIQRKGARGQTHRPEGFRALAPNRALHFDEKKNTGGLEK